MNVFTSLKSHLFRWLFALIAAFKKEAILLRQFPFTIGEQYENYEFDLDYVDSRFRQDLIDDVYRYIREDKQNLFGLSASKILIYFNVDRLVEVEYQFTNHQLDHLLSKINSCLSKSKQIDIHHQNAKVYLTQQVTLELKIVNNQILLCLKSNQ